MDTLLKESNIKMNSINMDLVAQKILTEEQVTKIQSIEAELMEALKQNKTDTASAQLKILGVQYDNILSSTAVNTERKKEIVANTSLLIAKTLLTSIQSDDASYDLGIRGLSLLLLHYICKTFNIPQLCIHCLRSFKSCFW
ncbi:MAG: hypothetical protein R3Y15_06100 [Rikenellaceae bacterium]